ncbi:cullin binding protein [Aureococcus anophagefferens]|uniref:Cullin binding protein n=1 Tax=Aureococcus anophagefferens TaxID=44056 RepID=A0ABR1G7L4_AURAN
MAEEPDIILVALRMALAGGIPERVTSLGALGAGDLMSIVARCVALVDTTGGDALPEALPSGVAAKHRACARTASRLKAMGYKGECGYNELLYPGESSTRPLLTWLVDKLPKDGGDAGPGAAPLGGRRARLGEAVRAWTAKRWRLPADRGGFSRGARFRTFAMGDCPLEYAVPSLLEAAATRAVQEARREAALERDADELLQEGGGRCAPLSGSGAVDLGWGTLGEMPSLKELLASLERGTETERARLGRLAHAARFDHGGGDDDAGPAAASPRRQRRRRRAARRRRRGVGGGRGQGAARGRRGPRRRAQGRARALGEPTRRRSATTRSSTKGRGVGGAQGARAALAALKDAGAHAEREYTVRRKTLEMLPESEAAILKLAEICGARRARKLLRRRKLKAKAMVDEMKRCRGEMNAMVLGVRDKDDRHRLLEERYAAMPKNVNRALYTYRIMDIIKQIAKQKGRSRRSSATSAPCRRRTTRSARRSSAPSALADERVFQEANAGGKDPQLVAAYRSLSDLRKLFEKTVTVISETGAKEREARDLDSKKKQLKARVSTANLDKILADLGQMADFDLTSSLV